MPVDTSGIDTVAVPLEQAVQLATRALAAVGVPGEDARKAATALVDADLQGISTHGIKNLAGYVRQVQNGAVSATPEIRVTAGHGAMQQMSGGNGLGHVVAHHGMERAISLAREHGVGCVFMRESNHYGASGYWARLAVQQGMAGFAFTNAAASIAPWGGAEAVVGNNPPAWAVPTGLEEPGEPPDSTYLDMALSVVAGNRLDIYRRRGQPIPEGWALDKDGQSTTDPSARSKGGTFMPIAEYKGFGMALMLSFFTTLLADGPFDYDQLRNDVIITGRSHWFLALDIQQLVPVERFAGRVREVAERVHGARRKPGVDRLFVPGDMERERARKQRREGLAYEPFILDDLRALAASLGIEYGLE